MPDDTPRVMRVLDLSTTHVPPHLWRDLPFTPGVICHEVGRHGHLLHVPWPAGEDAETAAWRAQVSPPEIAAIVSYAQSLECDYVLIDPDAGTVDALPVYVWP
jgi:hypothetical protein